MSKGSGLGLPMAFAHHFRPENTTAAIEHYRGHFVPSRWCPGPRVLLCVEAVCAPTRDEAEWLVGPMNVVKAGLLQGRSDSAFPTPAEAAVHPFSDQERHALAAFHAHQAYGDPETVVRRLTELTDATGAQELMLVSPVYALKDRLRSFELIAASAQGDQPVATA